jgi:hypothetical protein
MIFFNKMKRSLDSEPETAKKQKCPSPVQKAWDRIFDFKTIESPSSEQVVALDHDMTFVLRHHNVEKHCKLLGYSKRFHRFNDSYEHLTPKEELKMLRDHFWARSHQLDELKVLMNKKKEAIRKSCDHNWERDWEDRGHRSHWECKKCGAYR